ncbi:Conserved_hypothetical protein [Hexamita inflata]|uniref:Uncharacterized protein n=1 Tax=Hexamita inflata TaxID=28002 RepID=A0AA86PVG7_9EUKA|nr:Conserved hypothetical protein [Hexamita inflata]
MNDELLIQQYQKQVHHNQTQTLVIQANRSIQSFKFVDKLMIGNLQIQDCPKIQFTYPPKKVVELQVNYCDLKQLYGIEHMLQLRELSLSTNSIQNIAPLSALVNLACLDISSNEIQDLSALNALCNLRVLSVARNNVSSLFSLCAGYLPSLESLDVGCNNITDLWPLKRLRRLSSLTIYKNSVQNVNYKFISQLELFEASNNKITVFEPFEGANYFNQTPPNKNEIIFQAKLNVIYSMSAQNKRREKQTHIKTRRIFKKLLFVLEHNVFQRMKEDHSKFVSRAAEILQMEQMRQQ